MSDHRNLVDLFSRRSMLVFIGLTPLASAIRSAHLPARRLGFRLAQFHDAIGFEKMTSAVKRKIISCVD